jgi:hypothetical protein
MAPILTPELREELETEYKNNRSIAAFVAYYEDSKLRTLPYESVAAAYEWRFDLTTCWGYQTEEILIVNTFKEFEKEYQI